MSNPTKAQVRELLESNGLNIESIEDQSRTVYQLRLADESNPMRYVKIFSKRQKEAFLTLGELDQSIGMPKSNVFVTDEFGLHVMVPAEGTLLSYLLPKYLLPGVWGRQKHELQAAMNKLGRYLRTLHESTQRSQSELLLDSICIDRYDAVVNQAPNPIIRRELNNDISNAIERVFTQYPKIETGTSLVHGDVILRHLYWGNKDITIIDFDRIGVSGSIEDCVSFECTLDLMVSRLPYARRKQFKELIQNFYNGYGKKIRGENIELLKLIKYCSLLIYYINNTEPFWKNPNLQQKQLTRDIDVYILKRRIKQLINTKYSLMT